MAGALLANHAGLFLQTHLNENLGEIEWVRTLFPARSTYLDVYRHAGLVGRRSVFGHCVHMSEQDFCTCHTEGAAIAHCPTSNLFLGSGLFRLFDAVDPKRPVKVGLGTDIGAGTSLSHLQTLNEAYKVAALTGRPLSAKQASTWPHSAAHEPFASTIRSARSSRATWPTSASWIFERRRSWTSGPGAATASKTYYSSS